VIKNWFFFVGVIWSILFGGSFGINATPSHFSRPETLVEVAHHSQDQFSNPLLHIAEIEICFSDKILSKNSSSKRISSSKSFGKKISDFPHAFFRKLSCRNYFRLKWAQFSPLHKVLNHLHLLYPF
jgi:hypothetical protein